MCSYSSSSTRFLSAVPVRLLRILISSGNKKKRPVKAAFQLKDMSRFRTERPTVCLISWLQDILSITLH